MEEKTEFMFHAVFVVDAAFAFVVDRMFTRLSEREASATERAHQRSQEVAFFQTKSDEYRQQLDHIEARVCWCFSKGARLFSQWLMICSEETHRHRPDGRQKGRMCGVHPVLHHYACYFSFVNYSIMVYCSVVFMVQRSQLCHVWCVLVELVISL